MTKGKSNSSKVVSSKSSSKDANRDMTILLREHLVRFSAIANAGGVVATMSTISATASEGSISNILAVPLALFSIGVIFSLLNALNALVTSGEQAIRLIIANKDSSSLMIFVVELILRLSLKKGMLFIFGTIASFILGCFSGVVIIALA